MDDQQFLEQAEHHFRHMFYPPFGGQSFFNSTLFYFIVQEAADHAGRLDDEMKKVRERIGDPTHLVEMRVDKTAPAILITLSTPSENREVVITDGAIDVRVISVAV
jgi:hypothetical protein